MAKNTNTITKGTEPFYEHLQWSIENILNKESSEETFDWELGIGVLGYRAWLDKDVVHIEVKSS